MILILEDNIDRIQRFQITCGMLFPKNALKIWKDAPNMIREFQECLEYADLISLDHDLVPSTGAMEDPGTGRDVTRYLSELIPSCPIILHTSNADGGTRMEGDL